MDEALASEFRIGRSSLAVAEAGANRFADGLGRGGDFNRI